jgi:hypothetical protein
MQKLNIVNFLSELIIWGTFIMSAFLAGYLTSLVDTKAVEKKGWWGQFTNNIRKYNGSETLLFIIFILSVLEGGGPIINFILTDCHKNVVKISPTVMIQEGIRISGI